MKNLTENELHNRLYPNRKACKVTDEEVHNPDYEIWGRAREWTYHQAVCLLAGLSPISRPYFEILISDRSPLHLVNWYQYYPTNSQDRIRLNNLDILLQEIPLMAQAKKNKQTVSPKEVLALCKTQGLIAPSLPEKLIEVIEQFGPHLSLNLPNTFSSLEINPETFETMKKLEKRKQTPPTVVINSEPLSAAPRMPLIPSETPLALTKRLFPLINIHRWEQVDMFSLNEVILLHYGIEPVEILTQPDQPLPYKPKCPKIDELVTHIIQYFFGSVLEFMRKLDESQIFDLVDRALHAAALRSAPSNNYSPIILFSKEEIIPWMESKNLDMPIHSIPKSKTPEKRPEITKDEILSFDLKRFDKDQLARLIVRSAAASEWKKDKSVSLSKILNTPSVKEAIKLAGQIGKRKDGYDEKTIEDWIRDLNPQYSPKN